MTSTRGRHAPDVLAEFLRDDGRQAWARCLDGSMLRLDERGGIRELRERGRAGELFCPVLDCLAPEYDLAMGPVRRHSFRHRKDTKGGATGHSRETADHESGGRHGRDGCAVAPHLGQAGCLDLGKDHFGPASVTGWEWRVDA